MSKTCAVFFDLDNTLYSQSTDVIQRITQCIDYFSMSPKEEIAQFWFNEWKDNGPQKADLVERVIHNFGLSQTVGLVVDQYRSCKTILSLPDAHKRLLQKNRENKIHQFLITNGNVMTQRNKISSLGIENLFDCIVFATGKRAKPSAYWFEQLLTEHHLAPENCISIGDWYAVDGKASEKAGIRFVYIKTGPIKEIIPERTETIRTLTELERYIDYDKEKSDDNCRPSR
jgi:FMN phosphatase YigB (HAD superfamily)